ncbi:hypothetical protein FA046_15080 [Pedobacter cryophilus]|uniref:Uncharacterized protein n=1 Tax=Pedobacter cryophilus TaxID=2571271 RepID=A0A4U1BUN1_9SPHI|nr:hypothetical protein FA046_15080 [Pedobacter cryophilus]
MFVFGLGISVLSFSATPLSAQVNINVNIGSQPLWGPVGYDHVDYYYLPDVESYYYVPTRQFVYQNNGNWIHATNLPSRYSGYNLYRGYKVVINQPRPYLYFNNHQVKYKKYKGYYGNQNAIRYSNDSRYYVVKGHPHGMPPGQSKKFYQTRGYNSHGGYQQKNKNGGGKSKGNGKH